VEEWRVVEEAPNFLISNQGRVQNRTTGRMVKVSISKGYPKVSLSNNGQYFNQSVHRLVATAFVDGKKPGLVVNHIDGDKTNHRPENLEWITHAENMAHAREAGLIRKLRRWIDVDGELVEIEREKD
jgi:HNH endonuclease/NUMOD4 motif